MKGGSGVNETIRYSYYTSAKASQNTFYQLPRALYEKEYFKCLSNDAKTLYALMLDRMSLSLANDWLDEDGKVYINYSLEDIMERLNCGKTKAVALLKELDSENGIGLIEKKNMGIAKASVFYVKNFVCEEEVVKEEDDICHETTEETSISVKNFNSCVQKINMNENNEFGNQTCACSENELGCVQNLNPNKNNINNTDLNYNNQSNQSDRGTEVIDEMKNVNTYIKIIKDNIEYDYNMRYCDLQDKRLYNELFEIICDVVCVKHKTVRVGRSDYPYELVKSAFLKLKSSHLKYVINCMKNTTTEVTNIKSYMVTTLYNAPSTMHHYYQQKVQHDMPQYRLSEKGVINAGNED